MAQAFGKSQRTVRRWCELGVVPGAYRKNGCGQWRVRRFAATQGMEMERRVKKFARRRSKADALYGLPQVASGSDSSIMRAIEFKAAAHGIDIEDRRREALTAEQRHLMEDTPLSELLSRRIWNAAELPQTALATACQRLLLTEPSGKRLRAKFLARELGLSRATLYRKFSAVEIQRSLSSSHSTNVLPHERAVRVMKPKRA